MKNNTLMRRLAALVLVLSTVVMMWTATVSADNSNSADEYPSVPEGTMSPAAGDAALPEALLTVKKTVYCKHEVFPMAKRLCLSQPDG